MPKQNTKPDWPTYLAGRLEDGRLIGVDDSVWLYRKVPMAPVAEAKSNDRALAAAAPILAAYEGLAQTTSITTNRRALSRRAYRETHLLVVNIPTLYRPTPGPLEGYLADQMSDAIVFSRILLFGVKLNSTVGSGGFKAAIDSVAETIVSGGTPMSDYDKDFREVDTVLRNAGLAPISHTERNLADAWWNHGSFPDTPALFHSDHLHIFSSAEAAGVARNLGADNCQTWPELDGTHTLTFASAQDIDLPYVDATSSNAQWLIPFIQNGAAAVSIRGAVEPSKVTREELRRQRKQYSDDLNERYQHGKMDKAELEGKLDELTQVENSYATGEGPATIVDLSVLMAFDGLIEDMNDMSTMNVRLNTMMYRQQQAWAETMICSNVRANPYRHDLPSTAVAYSGAPSLSTVGDQDGALVGFTESDRQPALLSPVAVAQEDRTPLTVVAADSGSGKLLSDSQLLPTPSGFVRMGDVRVGDRVLGRDGKPCNVTFVSNVNLNPDLYRVTLSDGQTIDADFDHQWVVSDSVSRARSGKQELRDRSGCWSKLADVSAELTFIASSHDAGDLRTPEEIWDLIRCVDGLPWTAPAGIRAIFRLLETPVSFRETAANVNRMNRVLDKIDPVLVFPTKAFLEANIRQWRETGPSNRARWGTKLDSRVGAGTRLLDRLATGSLPDTVTAAEAIRLFTEEGAPMARNYAGVLAQVARKAEVIGVADRRTVRVPLPDEQTTKKLAVYSVPEALTSLAARVLFIAGEQPSLGVQERIVTTGEMLAEGLVGTRGEKNFAIRMSEPLDLPEATLPVPPYTMGAWLGDGSTGSGGFTGIDPEIIDEIRSDGFTVTSSTREDKTQYIRGLVPGLRSAGVLGFKHIPMLYLRASMAQRVAVLQGIMDTDGTIDEKGSCELSFTNERLATDSLELVRSLGIKASMSSSEAAHTLRDDAGNQTKVVTGTRYRVHFTTARHVFRLPRKRERVLAVVGKTQDQLYVESIVKIPAEPGRCIQVDSPDSTYLAAGFVPTHNTVMMLWLADQFARMGRPVIIVDPKTGSDLSPAVKASGGQVSSLDDLMSSDGVLDPLRFAITTNDGIEMASSMLLSVNPFGDHKLHYEVPLMTALNYGVQNGATCIGQALVLAAQAGHAPAEMVNAVINLANASPQFRAMVGFSPTTEALRVHDGITYIKVGRSSLNLPTPGTNPEQMDISQRVSLALVRMMLFGSATALTNRDGVIMQDEAWTILGSGAKEVERLGRLARSQRVLPILFSQDISGAVNAKLAGYISRGFVGPISDPVEARAAMELFGIEATDERLARLTASATMDSFGRDEFAAPNWNSMKALRDPRSKEVLRGSVWLYSDLSGRVIPVECTIPPGFLKLASTNAADLDAREKALHDLVHTG